MKINSNVIKKLRASKNWSQENLSEASGLSLRTIQRLENGGNASIESVRALADTFEIDPNALIISEQDAAKTPVEAVKKGFVQFSDFSGTATRYEYWWFMLFVLLALAVSTIIHEQAYQVLAVILLLPFLAVGTRRLNHIEHSAWWQLLWLVPFGQVVVCYLLAQNPDQKMKNGLETV